MKSEFPSCHNTARSISNIPNMTDLINIMTDRMWMQSSPCRHCLRILCHIPTCEFDQKLKCNHYMFQLHFHFTLRVEKSKIYLFVQIGAIVFEYTTVALEICTSELLYIIINLPETNILTFCPNKRIILTIQYLN